MQRWMITAALALTALVAGLLAPKLGARFPGTHMLPPSRHQIGDVVSPPSSQVADAVGETEVSPTVTRAVEPVVYVQRNGPIAELDVVVPAVRPLREPIGCSRRPSATPIHPIHPAGEGYTIYN